MFELYFQINNHKSTENFIYTKTRMIKRALKFKDNYLIFSINKQNNINIIQNIILLTHIIEIEI